MIKTLTTQNIDCLQGTPIYLLAAPKLWNLYATSHYSPNHPFHISLGNEPQRPDSTRNILIHDEDKATDIEIWFHSQSLGALL